MDGAGAPNIAVIDYESGNLRSVAKALETAGVSPVVTSDPAVIAKADALILPGVGSGPAAMAALAKRALVEPIREYADSGRPFLGICLGLQLFLERTEELSPTLSNSIAASSSIKSGVKNTILPASSASSLLFPLMTKSLCQPCHDIASALEIVSVRLGTSTVDVGAFR